MRRDDGHVKTLIVADLCSLLNELCIVLWKYHNEIDHGLEYNTSSHLVITFVKTSSLSFPSWRS